MGDIPQNSSHQIEENAVLMTEMIRVKIGRCRTNLSCLQAGNISSAEDIENEKRWLCVKRKGKKKNAFIFYRLSITDPKGLF